jgi:CheY-like chemotaxis protein
MARILIADDEALIALSIAMLLEDDGHEVAVASDGRMALAMARDTPPDLLITDYMMPVMDGLELIAALRGDDDLRTLPVIMSSAIPEPQLRARADGFDRFVPKPVSDATLLKAVRALLENRNDG